MATHKRLRPIRTNHKARLNTLTIAKMSEAACLVELDIVDACVAPNGGIRFK
ncbi:Uncharacterised protein [Vibrio cholerae]|uniref:Uncharacterized protein n=1 Tax=Vibrio cholerae TaxID=666 RepID=A0A655V224_VIBCL|nr:Uncharacterised protein [Vibrio cholerae]